MKIPAINLTRPLLTASLACLIAVSASPLRGQMSTPANYATPTAPAQGNSLASLNEDVQMLAREVNRLRLELETLRQTNENLQKQVLTQREIQIQIQNAAAAGRADSRADLAAARKEITDAVAKQIETLAKATDEQLKKLAKAMQDSPARGSAVTVNAVPVRKFEDNYPHTGINYTVKSGESLSLIARQNNSTVEWIQNANQINDPNDVRAGQSLFIPQKPANAPAGN